jgi:AcrR family transcriptional regulator
MPPRDRTKRRIAPSQERAQASAQAILQAAELLLHEQGFARMTTNRIAARAGVNVALVYRYFAGKEAIVGALIERIAAQTREHFHTVMVAHADSPLPIAFRALLAALVDTPEAPALHRELVEHIDITKRRAHVKDQAGQMAQLFAAFLLKRSAELRPLKDPAATLFVLEHALEAATNAAAFYRPAELSLERALDALTEVLTRTLLPGGD